MFSEILKIIPKLDSAAMSQMENSLSSRFGKVAKKFGSGLKTALLGGGVTGFVLTIVNKILNPLEEVQKAIDETLHVGDNVDTFATQFHTTPGQLMNLQALANAKGLDSESLYQLMLKFQEAVTKARANPSEPSSVRNFVNDQDTAASFFSFIQSLQKLTAAQRDFVQSEVFGARQVLKASEFLNTTDYNELAQKLRLRKASEIDPFLRNAANLEERQAIGRTRREYINTINRSGLITPSMIDDELKRDQIKANILTSHLDPQGYNGMKQLQITGDKISGLLETGFIEVAKYLPVIARALGELAASRQTRGQTRKKDK